jgi:hypothetical protein
MDMVVVVHPTLDDYSSRVRMIADRHGFESWLELFECPEKMSEDERDDFSFITMAVGDQLIHREFIDSSRSQGEDDVDNIQAEPGVTPGSAILPGVMIECPRLCGTHY